MTNALDLWWQHNLKMTLIHHVFWLSKDFYKMESGWKNVWSCLLFSPTFNAFQDPEHSSSPDTWHHGKIVKIGKLSNSIFRNIKSPPDVQNCQNYCLSDTFLNILLYRYTGWFFNWPPPEFAKCWPVSNWFQKTLESQTGPPSDRKTPKCLA